MLDKFSAKLGGQKGIKWIKSKHELQHFVKNSDNRWVEYQNGRKYAEFSEISFQHPVVVLKKDDGAFIKLTENSGYLGHSQDSIYNHFTDGQWENTS